MLQAITLNGSNVTAEIDAYINHGIHGSQGIVEFGNSMTAEIVTNNSIRIKDGLLINQGRYMRIVPGSYETVAISNGTTGVNRIDLIVARFETDGATERHSIVVKKGTANGTKPTVTKGDTFNGATINEVPLYSVHLTGLNITKVERELDLIKNSSDTVHLGFVTDPDTGESKPFTPFERLHLEFTFTNKQNIDESYTLASLGIGNAKEFWIDQSLSYYNYGGVASINRYASANSLSNVYIDGTPQLRLIFKEVVPIAKIVYHITINYRV